MTTDLKQEVIDLFKYLIEHRYYCSVMMQASAEKVFKVIDEQEKEIIHLRNENQKLKQGN